METVVRWMQYVCRWYRFHVAVVNALTARQHNSRWRPKDRAVIRQWLHNQ